MRAVHARCEGRPGVILQIGDSITDSMAFFAPLEYAATAKLPPEAADALPVLQNYIRKECYRWKGGEYGNASGQTAAWAVQHIDEWLERHKPELAIVMFGTNDVRRGSVEQHEANLRTLTRRCLDRGVVVILSTIPPMHGHDDAVRLAVERQRKLAEEFHLPLIDFYAHVIHRRPDDWDGTLPQFAAFDTYEVPTLICKDGVHPSNPQAWRNDYTAEGQRHSGFVLRNYLALLACAEVIRTVFDGKAPDPRIEAILGPDPFSRNTVPEEAAAPVENDPFRVPDWFPKAPALPAPWGRVVHVQHAAELMKAVQEATPETTILLAPGRYLLPRSLQVRTDGLQLRGETGNRQDVILDFSASSHHEGVTFTNCRDVVLADLTIENVRQNGIKINSNLDVDHVLIHNVISHNVWQRHVKGPGVPDRDGKPDFVENCTIEYCLFVNDRPKRPGDEPYEDEHPEQFRFNYVGGIDAMNARGWMIRHNVFRGIRGASGEGRGAVFLWHNAQDCLVEGNLAIDCDSGICLGNSSARGERRHANGCIVRNNFVVRCSESNILADHTRDCRILHNAVFDPDSKNGRLLRIVHANDGLEVAGNLFCGPRIVVESDSPVQIHDNLIADVPHWFRNPVEGDLHLTAAASQAFDRCRRREDVLDDFDGAERDDPTDIGADEFDRP
ncbi:hypothetical protein JCM19992_09970 [Thermostilla marina]